MRFYATRTRSGIPPSAKFVLLYDNWNDHGYYTSYGLFFTEKGKIGAEIGYVRIARVDQEIGERSIVDMPLAFDSLDANFISVGVGSEFYKELGQHGGEIQKIVLEGLNDIAFDFSLYRKHKSLPIINASLFRDLQPKIQVDQFRRIIRGENENIGYSFSVIKKNTFNQGAIEIEFDVDPSDLIPSNIHGIIGRNGVGKTTLFSEIVDSLRFSDTDLVDIDNSEFSNLFLVSYSPFDSYRDDLDDGDEEGIKFKCFGLEPDDVYVDVDQVYFGNVYGKEISERIREIEKLKRVPLLRHAINILTSDPIFAGSEVVDLILSGEELGSVGRVFSSLSSGHSRILLTIISLVSSLREKSLVLLDEPEAHLHPPLLSAFIKSISYVLKQVNGVCIIATHSPVVLQELPRKCVSILERSGDVQAVRRPATETYGENVGILTHEVFRLEVLNSGFYKVLVDLSNSTHTYEEAMSKLGSQLGSEGRAILLTLFAKKKR